MLYQSLTVFPAVLPRSLLHAVRPLSLHVKVYNGGRQMTNSDQLKPLGLKPIVVAERRHYWKGYCHHGCPCRLPLSFSQEWGTNSPLLSTFKNTYIPLRLSKKLVSGMKMWQMMWLKADGKNADPLQWISNHDG